MVRARWPSSDAGAAWASQRSRCLDAALLARVLGAIAAGEHARSLQRNRADRCVRSSRRPLLRAELPPRTWKSSIKYGQTL